MNDIKKKKILNDIRWQCTQFRKTIKNKATMEKHESFDTRKDILNYEDFKPQCSSEYVYSCQLVCIFMEVILNSSTFSLILFILHYSYL